jgi:hypothetical protein
MKSVEQAFKAAGILIQNGGFGMIALDLSNVDEELVRKIHLRAWFRFARVMEALTTALVVLLTHSAAQSCAALTLNLSGVDRLVWLQRHNTYAADFRCSLLS